MVQSLAQCHALAPAPLLQLGSSVGRVLVVDPDVAGRKMLEGRLRSAYHALVWTLDSGQLGKLLQSFDPEVVLLHVGEGPEGLRGLEEAVASAPRAVFLAVVSPANRDMALETIRAGAENYVLKPFEPDEVELHVERALEKARLRREASDREPTGPYAVETGEASTLPAQVPGLTMAQLERWAIQRTLAAVGGSTAQAAALLGISQRKIQYRIKEWGHPTRAVSVGSSGGIAHNG